MLRAVLAVLLSLAILAAATPVVEDAREQRTRSLVAAELTRVADHATGLADDDEATAEGAARRVLDISLPDGGLGTAAVAYVAVGGVPDCGTPLDTAAGDVIAYRLRGGPPRVAHVPVDLRVVTDGAVRADRTPLVLRGDATLTLSLVAAGDDRRVHVRRGYRRGAGGPRA